MKIISVDCGEIHSRQELHSRLSEALLLPEWYGNNLDALYDCLTDLHTETAILLLQFDALRQELGNYAEGVRRVLRDASWETPMLHVHLFE